MAKRIRYKRLSAEQLNELNANVKEKGFTPRTDLKYIQEMFSAIVIRAGLKNSGSVRTYEQAYQFLQRKQKDNFVGYSIEEYEADLKLLNKQLAGWQTERGYNLKYRQQLLSTVATAADVLGIEPSFDISKIPTVKLLEYVKIANEIAKMDTQGSASFYNHLMDLLEERYGTL